MVLFHDNMEVDSRTSSQNQAIKNSTNSTIKASDGAASQLDPITEKLSLLLDQKFGDLKKLDKLDKIDSLET